MKTVRCNTNVLQIFPHEKVDTAIKRVPLKYKKIQQRDINFLSQEEKTKKIISSMSKKYDVKNVFNFINTQFARGPKECFYA